MGVEYAIVTKDRQHYEMEGHACYAGFGNSLDNFRGRVRAHTKKPVNKADFLLYVECGPTTIHYKATTKADRLTAHNAFDVMFGRWSNDGQWFWPEDADGNIALCDNPDRVRIVYAPECPWWVVVASGSVYRFNESMSNFYFFWAQLDKLQEDMGYVMQPFTQYFLVTNMCNIKATGMNLVKNPVVLTGSNTGHMAFDSTIVDYKAIEFMNGWQSEHFIKGREWESQGRQPGKAGKIVVKREALPAMSVAGYNYPTRGRDTYFCGRVVDYGENRIAPNWMLHYAKMNKISPEDIGAVESMNRYTAGRLDYRKFIETVVIPLNM